jgi:peptidyl-prolyl cis-trans isomerase B (cyclophilin B)
VFRGLALVTLAAALAVPSVAAAPAARDATGCVTVKRPAAKPDGGQKPPKTKLDPKKKYDVTFTTNCGSFTIRLAVRTSPHITASFFDLAKKGFFTRTYFHRIVPGFVIQGGDPTGTGTGGPGYSTVDKPPGRTTYRKYLAAMAKTQLEPAGTAGSQFFVDLQDVQLPPDYGVLGTVFKGRRVVDKIGKLGNPNDPQGRPTKIVEILKTTVSVR